MREPRSIEEWKEYFRRDANRRPDWTVLPIEILYSVAYLSLRSCSQLALLYVWSQVQWKKKANRPNRKKRKQLEKDTIYLPTNALRALGITSSDTQTKLRKELVEKGFLDVVTTGSFLNPGVFRISYRFRQYPAGDYRPKDQRPAGRRMGHCIPKGGLK